MWSLSRTIVYLNNARKGQKKEKRKEAGRKAQNSPDPIYLLFNATLTTNIPSIQQQISSKPQTSNLSYLSSSKRLNICQPEECPSSAPSSLESLLLQPNLDQPSVRH
jgi:hypothetical protein